MKNSLLIQKIKRAMKHAATASSVLTLTVVSLLLAAPGQAAANTHTKTKIRLVALSSAPGFNIWAAKELGFFEQEGLEVESLKFVPNGPAAVAAGYAGSWDAAYLGGPPAINAGAKFNLQVAGLLDVQQSNYKVFIRNDAPRENIAQYLTGKTALTITASNLHYFLDTCLKHHKVDPASVKKINLAPPNIVTAADSGQGEIISNWAPFTMQLENSGKYRVLCEDNKQIGLQTFDAYVIHPDFIKAKPQAAAAFIRAVYRVNALMNTDFERMLALSNKFFNEIGLKLTPEQIRYSFKVQTYPSLEESLTLMKTGQIKTALEQAATFLVGVGAMESVPPINFINTEFIEAAIRRGNK